MVTSFHSNKLAPATQNQDKTWHPINGILATAIISGTAGGYLAFCGRCPSDHRMVWIDIPMIQIFETPPQHLQPDIQRQVSTKDPHLCRQYLKLTCSGYHEQDIGPQQLQLQEDWVNNKITRTDFITEFNSIDTAVLHTSVKSEKILRGGSA